MKVINQSMDIGVREMSEVFNDRRVCDRCDRIILMATETTDFIEGRTNPNINDEMVDGVYCFYCIEEMEEYDESSRK